LARAGKRATRLRLRMIALVFIAVVGVALVILRVVAQRPDMRTIEVGPHPVALSIDPDNGRAYVASTGNDSVSVLDIKTAMLIRVVRVGPGPQRVLVMGRNRRAFVINYGRGVGSVSVLDAMSGRLLRTTPVGGSATNAVTDIQTGRIFVATTSGPELAGRVVILDARDGRELGTVPVGNDPIAMAISERAGRVFVVNTGSGTVSMLDARSGTTIRTVGIGWLSGGIVVDERVQHAFIVARSDNAVAVLDAYNGRLLHKTRVGHDPGAIVLDKQDGHAFITNMGDGSTSVLDTASGRLVGTLRVGQDISMMFIAARGHRLLIGDKVTGAIHAFDARTLTPLYTSNLGSVPFAGVADDLRGLAIVTALGGMNHGKLPTGQGMVAVIDAMSGNVLQRLGTGSTPYFVGVDERVGRAFVVDGSEIHENNTWAWVPQAVRGALSLPSSTRLVSSARVIILDDEHI